MQILLPSFLVLLGYQVNGKFIGRTQCPEGYVLWPVDMTCHLLFSQGPCEPYQQLMNHPDGAYCQNIQEKSAQEGAWGIGGLFPIGPTLQKKDGWTVPLNESELSESESNCLKQDKVYWPDEDQCYSLLSAGPCARGEWLVLDDDDRVVCKERICPCDPASPEFCEVEVREGDVKCKVALAAAQDGICGPGEQLILDPYGYGVCGCIISPPHARWPEDDRCYPLSTQGPCESGFQLSISGSRLGVVCTPDTCTKKNSARWEDGQCYELGSKGPCEDMNVYAIDAATSLPNCMPIDNEIKRVYDLLPRGFIRDGPVSFNLKAANCEMDERGKCRNSLRSRDLISRKRQDRLYVRNRSPRRYLKWLRSFKSKRS